MSDAPSATGNEYTPSTTFSVPFKFNFNNLNVGAATWFYVRGSVIKGGVSTPLPEDLFNVGANVELDNQPISYDVVAGDSDGTIQVSIEMGFKVGNQYYVLDYWDVFYERGN